MVATYLLYLARDLERACNVDGLDFLIWTSGRDERRYELDFGGFGRLGLDVVTGGETPEQNRYQKWNVMSWYNSGKQFVVMETGAIMVCYR